MGASGQLDLSDLPTLVPATEEVVVEVAGCGLCHTDIGFAYEGVPTRHPLPLVLGHEIAGRVVATGEDTAAWMHRNVIIPAVIPCGACEACRAGRPTICRHQFMPGNDGDGGFASHVVVPARGLCGVPDELPHEMNLATLSVIADAVTTPYEALRRAEVGPGDLAVIVGAGGIGGFAVQIARALGATVVAIDIDEDRLELAADGGADLALDSSAMTFRELKQAIRTRAHVHESGTVGWKIFEMSGTAGGQQTAFGLLDYGSWLGIVGYTPKKLELRLSNVMAYDATIRGNWGCSPEHYPSALQLVLDGSVRIEPCIENHALEELPELFKAAAGHGLRRRAVLIPNQPSRGNDA
jgi:6-hydroxycyclohex-1-ene-1-carbonyl-CoA dehydrogenase